LAKAGPALNQRKKTVMKRMLQQTLMTTVLTSAIVAAQSAPQFKPPANEAEEVTLALSALPESMRAAAGVHVLGPKGYRKVKDSTSGVHCLVERSRPDTMEPICWDREGVETIMPLALARAEWRAAGHSESELDRREAEGFANGTFRAPRRAGVAYMLSTQNWVFTGKQVIQYGPHVMFYAPYLRNADIGADGKNPNAPWVLNEGSPHAYMIVTAGRH
jgi:hypothetical protein